MLGNVAGLTILASRVGDSHFTIVKTSRDFQHAIGLYTL